MSERRRYKRLPMRGFMECSVEFISGDKTRSLPVLSLSAGGMYVAVNEREDFDLHRGASLSQIRFSLPELSTLILAGQVAHRMSLGEIGGCGIEFGDSEVRDITQLEHFVEEKLKEFGLASI